jgi:glycerophosphoryl diester phosphodiesterase
MIVYAHRGANTELPENTLEAFRLAVELGADALETDVHLTRDGAIVVHHDPTGLRTASTREAIADRTLEDVRRWNLGFGFRNADGTGLVNAVYRVPTLSEFLEAFPDIRVNLDVKPPSTEAARVVIEMVRRHGAEERVLLTSFYDHVVRAVRAAGYKGETGLARAEVLRVLAAPAGTPRWLLPDGVRAQIPLRVGRLSLARETLVRRLQGLGYAVDFWVVNTADDAKLAREVGADGVMTDDPRTVVPAAARAT